MNRRESKLQDRIFSLSTNELKRIVKKDRKEYTNEAILLAQQELKRREINNEIHQDESKSTIFIPPKKSKIHKNIQIIISVCIMIILISFNFYYGKRILYKAPEKGEYGTRRLTWHEIIKEDPLKVLEFISLWAMAVLIYFILKAAIKKFKKDWLR